MLSIIIRILVYIYPLQFLINIWLGLMWVKTWVWRLRAGHLTRTPDRVTCGAVLGSGSASWLLCPPPQPIWFCLLSLLVSSPRVFDSSFPLIHFERVVVGEECSSSWVWRVRADCCRWALEARLPCLPPPCSPPLPLPPIQAGLFTGGHRDGAHQDLLLLEWHFQKDLLNKAVGSLVSDLNSPWLWPGQWL